MTTKFLAPILAAAGVAAPFAVCAQSADDWSLSGNVSLVSDYRYRGISQTFRLPAVQGGFDVGHRSGFYAGTWASNVSGNNYTGGNGMEWDFYGGVRLDLTRAVQLDVGVLQYYYPGAKNTVVVGGPPPVTTTRRYDTTELYVGATAGPYAGKFSITTGDYFGLPDSSGSWYAEGNYNRPITTGLNVLAHLGRQQIRGRSNLSYFDYKLGITAEALSLTWGVAVVGTNADHNRYRVAAQNASGQVKDTSKATIVVSVGKAF